MACALALAAAGCGTQINTLRNAATLRTGASGVPPSLTSFALTDASPTNHASLGVSWGVPVGGASEYCLLENSSDVLACVWHSGTLPTSYVDSSADGGFALTAYLKNDYGVSDAYVSNTITIDRTAPVLAWATVGNADPTNDPVFAISYGAVTFAPYVEYCMQENNTSSASCSWTAGALPSTFNVNPTNGSKAISIWLRDAAGNVSGRVTTAPILFDGSTPTVAFTSPAAGSYANIGNASAFAISGTCSENGRNVVISGAASATVACSGGTWNTTVDVSGVGSGPFTLKADHSNAAGTSAVQATRGFNADSNAPTVAIVLPTAGSYANNANKTAFAISGTCSENGQNVVISGAGSATVACAGGTWSTTVDVSGAADGSITLRADHSDVAGNPAAQDSRVFTKDTGNPALAITAPAAASYVSSANVTAFAVSGTCSENGRTISISGTVTGSTVCAAGAWSINLDFSAASEGAVTVQADLSDAAGNSAAQASIGFVKDTVAPSLASAAITNSSPTNSTTYALSYGAVTGSYADYCILENSTAVGGCSWTTAALPANFTVSSTENAKILSVWLRDAAGNVSSRVDTNSVTLLTTAPTLASVTVTNANPTNSTTYALAFGATTGSPSQYCILENSTTVGSCAWTAYPLPASFAVSATENAKVLSVWLKDGAGNVSNRVDSNSVTYDITPPTLAGVSILNTSPTPSRGYLLSYTGLSEAISAYCILQNDATVTNCAWTSATALPDSFTVSATQGANVLTVWVRDAAGNQQAAGRNSNSVTYQNVLAISPASSTISAAFSTDSYEGSRSGHVATMLANGKVLFAGGCNLTSGGPNIYYSVAKLYDPTTDSWSFAGHLSVPRCYAAWAKLADGRVFVAGGQTADNTSSNTVDIYDPATNTWSATYPMTTARAYANATVLASGKVLVSGGFTNTNGTVRNTTEIYDPSTQVWIAGPTMGASRFHHRAILRGNGTVLIIGGLISSSNSTATTDVFTPSGHQGTIAAGPSMAQKRGDFGAILLSASESPTGSEAVLAIAGFDGNATYRNSVELYDGTSWTTKTAITGTRRGASYVKFADGTVFVTGGTVGSGPIGTSGLYDPKASSGAGTWTSKATSGVNGSWGICQYNTVPILLANGKVMLVFGDSSTGGGHPNLYDPVADSWNTGGTAHPSYPSFGQVQGPMIQLTSTGKVLTCGWRSNITWESPHCLLLDPQKGVVLPTGDQTTGHQREFGNLIELSDGRVLTLGGAWNGISQAHNSSEIYDPATDVWTLKANLPSYVFGQKSALLSGNRVLAVGGYAGTAANNASLTNKTFIYDVAANTWTSPASANLPNNLNHHSIVRTPTGRVFIYGGTNGTNPVKTLYEWNDGTSSWTAKTSSSTARQGALAVYIPGGVAGKIIAIGGYTAQDSSATGTSEIYDINSDSWTAGPSLPSSITQAHLCGQYLASQNKVYFVGNWTGSAYFAGLFKYDVAGNTITAGASGQVSGPSSSDYQLGLSCGVLNDGRFWNAGGEYSLVHVVNDATPVRYTASQGDGNYAFSLTSGTGTLDDRHVFIPAAPLASGSSTVRVDDGSGQNASATATVP